jgi:hypothetical protein
VQVVARPKPYTLDLVAFTNKSSTGSDWPRLGPSPYSMADISSSSSPMIRNVQTLGDLCSMCRFIGRSYTGSHHTPGNLITSANMGCPCCKLIVDAAGDNIPITNRCSEIKSGDSGLGYTIFKHSGYEDKFSLTFDFVRRRGTCMCISY